MADQVVQITAGTGTKIDVSELTIGANTVERQRVAIGSNTVGSDYATIFPAGFLRVSDEPTQLFYDPFDSALDTTARWSAASTGNSGVAASITTGTLTLGTGTVANGYSYLQSQGTFPLVIPAWLGVSFAVQIENPVTANAYRFWGFGTNPGTPTTAAPLTDAVGFELATTGKLYAVVYAGGVRTAVQDLSSSGNSTQPTDSSYHRYILYVRTDRSYWYIDGLATAVATSSFQSPQIQTLPVKFLAVGGATPPASSGVITCAGVAAWDTGKNAQGISDGTFPWRKAAVGKSGGLSVRGTSITGSSGSIAVSGTGTIGPVDVSEAGNVTFVVKNTVAASAFTGSPVIVFEQSDDSVSWALLQTIRSDTGAVSSTFTIPAGTANGSLMFDAALEGVNYVRARVTTGPATNAMTVVIQPGGMPFSPYATVKEGKDIGRTNLVFHATAAAAGTTTTETAITLTRAADNSATTSAASFVITSGKSFRITSIVFATLGHTTATAQNTVFKLRINTAGAVTTSSTPIVISSRCATPATASAYDRFIVPIPDGLEFTGNGTIQFGVTAAATYATNAPTWDVFISGFEY